MKLLIEFSCTWNPLLLRYSQICLQISPLSSDFVLLAKFLGLNGMGFLIGEGVSGNSIVGIGESFSVND